MGKIKEFISRPKGLMLVIFILSFSLKLTYSIVQFNRDCISQFGDDKAYMHFAQCVATNGPWVTDLNQLGSYAQVVGPGIGWIDGLIVFLGGGWLTIFVINSIIGGLTCVLVYLIGRNVFNSEKTGMIAALIACIYPLFFRYVPTAGKEVWIAFFLNLCFLLIYLIAKRQRNIWFLLIFSFVYAFFIHLDERYIVYGPFFFFLLIFLNLNRIKGLKHAMVFSVLVLILLIPWTIRNYKVYDRIILISVRTNPITERVFNYPKKEFYDRNYNYYISSSRMDSILNGLSNTMNNGIILSEDQIKEMQKGNLPKQLGKGGIMLASFRALWQPVHIKGMYYHNGYRYLKWSTKHNLLIGLTYGIILLFAIPGLYIIFRKSHELFWFCFGVIFTHTFIHVVFIPFSEERYRIPIDYLLILIAAYGIVSYFNIEKKENIVANTAENVNRNS
jgi:4-amino-4-deoxy-L-arabinose transferase-like glycosyltransferase